MRRTLEQIEQDHQEENPGEDIHDFTCFRCGSWNDCEYAFDPYNTNGDCLWAK